MPHSLLTQAKVNEVLARAYQLKQRDQVVPPIVLLATNTGKERILPLPEFSADALARQAQFQAIGQKYPDTAEALFVCDTWMVIMGNAVGELDVPPSQHPNRQETLLVVGRNRDKTKTIVVNQIYTPAGKRFIWQTSEISTEPGSLEGLVDFIFDP